MIPILIPAAGRSSRMRGTDKLLQTVDGLPLLRRQAQMAAATGQPVFVALGPDQDVRRAVLEDLDVSILQADDAAEGLGATLRNTVAQLPDAARFMIVLADLVTLQTDDLQRVIAAADAEPEYLIWRGATAEGKAGHPILFDHSLKGAFSTITGDHGGNAIIRDHRRETKQVILPDQRARFDLDTPEDWQAWQKTTL
ncbi:MAG: nucleotidyltransferase family protein [Yoonia sp.]|uniref:nucleotidyltransferase family protein n=1 Tax=Yoonia sp. TaxID=2212373 RepID=UPI003EF8FC7D